MQSIFFHRALFSSSFGSTQMARCGFNAPWNDIIGMKKVKWLDTKHEQGKNKRTPCVSVIMSEYIYYVLVFFLSVNFCIRSPSMRIPQCNKIVLYMTLIICIVWRQVQWTPQALFSVMSENFFELYDTTQISWKEWNWLWCTIFKAHSDKSFPWRAYTWLICPTDIFDLVTNFSF